MSLLNFTVWIFHALVASLIYYRKTRKSDYRSIKVSTDQGKKLLVLIWHAWACLGLLNNRGHWVQEGRTWFVTQLLMIRQCDVIPYELIQRSLTYRHISLCICNVNMPKVVLSVCTTVCTLLDHLSQWHKNDICLTNTVVGQPYRHQKRLHVHPWFVTRWTRFALQFVVKNLRKQNCTFSFFSFRII